MWGRGGRASMPVTTSRSCLFNGETSTLTRTSCGPGGGGSSMWTRRSTCAGSPNGSIWVARISIPLHRRLGRCVSLPNGYALLPREVRPRYCGCLPSPRDRGGVGVAVHFGDGLAYLVDRLGAGCRVGEENLPARRSADRYVLV